MIPKDESGRLYKDDPENREYLSSHKCVVGGGDVLPNMFILSGKQHLEKWFEENDLDDNFAFAVSDSGYPNDKIRLEWLEHFGKHTHGKNEKGNGACLSWMEPRVIRIQNLFESVIVKISFLFVYHHILPISSNH